MQKSCLCHNFFHFTFTQVSFCFFHFQTLASFYKKLCSTIFQVPFKFVTPKNWLCVLSYFFVSKGFFFICENLSFCKVSCVVKHCYLYDSYCLASVATFKRSWCISLLSLFCFNFIFLVYWFIYCSNILCCQTLHLVWIFLQHFWTQHL